MIFRWRRIAASLLIFVIPCAQAESFEGVVTHVSDGDTVWVRPASGEAPRSVRLEGIDAPEVCQTFGTQSRDALAKRILHRHVTVTTSTNDVYHRAVGQVRLGSADMAGWMVGRGYAWSSEFRGHKGPYARQEVRARKARLGLWHEDNPTAPREFRKAQGSCSPAH